MNIHTFRPSYLLRRLWQIRFQRQYPDAPWLTESAVLMLRSYLRPDDVGLEWGSGRSTIWLAKRVGKLTSVEHDQGWHEIVRGRLSDAGVAAKVDYSRIACDAGEFGEPNHHPYVQPALDLSDDSLDFALVDGMIRAVCMKTILAKIKPAGLLILDNANRFLPNVYDGKPTTVHEPRYEPQSRMWAEINESLRRWRSVHTTDGIWDTRFWIKPFS